MELRRSQPSLAALVNPYLLWTSRVVHLLLSCLGQCHCKIPFHVQVMPTEEIILNISVSEWKRDGGSTLEAGSQPLPDFQTSHNCMLRQPGSCFSRHQAPLRTVCWLSVAREQRALATLPPACLFQHAAAQGVLGRAAGADVSALGTFVSA